MSGATARFIAVQISRDIFWETHPIKERLMTSRSLIAKWPSGMVCGVLLIGFDTFAAPMDDKIAELEQQEDLKARGWRLVAH